MCPCPCRIWQLWKRIVSAEVVIMSSIAFYIPALHHEACQILTQQKQSMLLERAMSLHASSLRSQMNGIHEEETIDASPDMKL